jgi:glycosyltransferase involved in cell wall biosynthesis
MTRIAILTSHLTSGDAVSNDVIGMGSALERNGYDARVYAESWDLDQPEIWPMKEIAVFLESPSDIVIYHHSIGWDAGIELLESLNCRKAIKYHNVTPPEFFAGVSRWHEEKCGEGRQQLGTLARAGCDLYLSDSEFNSRELVAAGANESKSFVVPPFHHIDRLQSIEPDLETLDTYRDGNTMLLSVSRVAPHKGQSDLIEAFAAYHHDYNQNSRLVIVGREEKAFASYSAQLREMIKFLVLEEVVVFAGEVSNAELKAYYLLANAFMFASKHEGFCVPLVEAMAMKNPIVAYSCSAIPETVGKAGLLLDGPDSRLLAESVDLVIKDESVNVALGMTGWRRYRDLFTNEAIENVFLRALKALN